MTFVDPVQRRSAGNLRFLAGLLLVLAAGAGVGLMVWRGGSGNRAATPAARSADSVETVPVTAPTQPPAYPEATPMTEMLLVPQDEIDATFRLELAVELDHLPAELILLPDSHPVSLVARLDQRRALPGGFRLENLRFVWSTNQGEVFEQTKTDEEGYYVSRAIFYPPKVSDFIELKAAAEIDLIRDVAGREQRATSRIESALALLSPIDSVNMVNGRFGDYEVGEYLDPFDRSVASRFRVDSDWYARYPERYMIPRVFYRADQRVKPMRISPSLELGLWMIDFPWKSLGATQYIALDYHLVRKLEDLIALMRAAGYTISRLVAIYGFRPPAFNLGKIQSEAETTLKVPFSMHQYGRALDFIIDEDDDGLMDDLNGDGRCDVHDPAVIMHYVNALDRRYRAEGRMHMVGGAGLYHENDFLERNAHYHHNTPYIHVDTRGFLHDDGTLVRWPNTWPDGTTIRWGHIDEKGFASAGARIEPTPEPTPDPHRPAIPLNFDEF